MLCLVLGAVLMYYEGDFQRSLLSLLFRTQLQKESAEREELAHEVRTLRQEGTAALASRDSARTERDSARQHVAWAEQQLRALSVRFEVCVVLLAKHNFMFSI